MTTFDTNDELCHLKYLTGGHRSPVGDYTADLIRRHGALVDATAVPQRELAEQLELALGTIELLSADNPAGLVERTLAGLSSYNDFVNGSDDQPLTAREAELKEVVSNLCDDIDRIEAAYARTLAAIDQYHAWAPGTLPADRICEANCGACEVIADAPKPTGGTRRALTETGVRQS